MESVYLPLQPLNGNHIINCDPQDIIGELRLLLWFLKM
jgi:hypothetical protein